MLWRLGILYQNCLLVLDWVSIWVHHRRMLATSHWYSTSPQVLCLHSTTVASMTSLRLPGMQKEIYPSEVPGNVLQVSSVSTVYLRWNYTTTMMFHLRRLQTLRRRYFLLLRTMLRRMRNFSRRVINNTMTLTTSPPNQETQTIPLRLTLPTATLTLQPRLQLQVSVPEGDDVICLVGWQNQSLRGSSLAIETCTTWQHNLLSGSPRQRMIDSTRNILLSRA